MLMDGWMDGDDGNDYSTSDNEATFVLLRELYENVYIIPLVIHSGDDPVSVLPPVLQVSGWVHSIGVPAKPALARMLLPLVLERQK
jgi:hypothetical protein